MGVKAVLFDIGGVVVQAELESYVELTAGLFKSTGAQVRAQAQPLLPALETGAIDSLQFWELLGESLQRAGQGQAVPAWKFKGFWAGRLEESAVINHEVVGFCKRLRARVRVGALSNVIEEHARVLVKMGVYEPFSPCLLSYQLKLRKPQPEIFARAADLLKTRLKNCLLIDDSAENVAAAQAAGMPAYQFIGTRELEDTLRSLRLL